MPFVSDDRFRRLIERSSDMILSMDLYGVVTAANPATEALLGYRPEEMLGTNIMERLAAGESERAGALFGQVAQGAEPIRQEIEHIARDGRSVWLDVSAFPIEVDGQIVGVEGIARDVTEQHLLRDELTRQSLHDSLTGLPNRRLCIDRIGHALTRAERDSSMVALVLIDIDDFKIVNDTLGHAAGDELLIDVADRLKSVLRESETVARMGGDEFVVIADGITSDTEALAIGKRILGVCQEAFFSGGTERHITVSIGIAISGGRASPGDLLRDSDVAMYRVKASGKGGIELFDTALRTEFLRQVALSSALGDALRDRTLEVHYQPIVSAHDGRILAVEALSRWRHPHWGWVKPDEFIPIAEASGMIVPLGQYVLGQALRDLAQWRKHVPVALPLGVFVNVSPTELGQTGFLSYVVETLAECKLAPADLAFELTERVMIPEDDRAALSGVAELTRIGIRLVIDDFGTGYSALSSLRRFPLSALKIDRDFVEEIQTADDPAPVTRALVGLGKTLGLMVIAEGVRTQVQSDYLRRLGCDALQGFGVGRPQVAAAVSDLIAAEDAVVKEAEQIARRAGEENRTSRTGQGAPIPPDDDERLAALHSFGVLDTEPELEIDAIARRAAEICDAPMAFVSLVDRDREYFKAAIGREIREGPRSSSFCGHAILGQTVFEVPDALRDPRFATNPDAVGGARVRSYAGAPLITASGYRIGVLCVKDTKPRTFTPSQRRALVMLGRQVLAQLALRRLLAELPAESASIR